ncbi:MAG TPA: SH3 domain-containing protein [Pyrinomonadaceae bacterium]
MNPLRRPPSHIAVAGARLRAFAACGLLLAFYSPSRAGAGALPPPRQEASAERITTATGARLRTAPQTSADEVSKLALGVVVRELERSAAKERIGAVEDFWYRVAAPGGAEGWVFGGLTAPFDARRRAETYLKLAGDRLKIEEPNYADAVALLGFVERVAPEMKTRAAVAELELLRLLALHKALGAIPLERLNDSPYKELVKEREALAVYSDPAGQWFVRADALWELEKKYRGLPVAERIAWEASRLPLPGECEGYLPCTLSYTVSTEGQYLRLYPRGAHAGEALDGISSLLDAVLEDAQSNNPVYEVPAADRASFRKELGDLGIIITRAGHPKGAVVLQKLNQLAARFR